MLYKIAIFTLLSVFVANVSQAQNGGATLEVEVIDGQGIVQEKAVVSLYASKEDFKNDANPIEGPKTTSLEGTVRFENLESKNYYIRVKMGEGANQMGGVKTDKLKSGELHRIGVAVSGFHGNKY